MIPVSNAWAALQNVTLQPEMFVEITYTVTEPGLQQDAVTSGNYPESFSDPSEVTSRSTSMDESYFTLDYGVCGLDGTISFSDETPKHSGYIFLGYSDVEGAINTIVKPTITIDFSERRTVAIPGMTITWSDTLSCWARDFIVRASNANGVVAQLEVRNNTEPVSQVQLELVNYSRITIEVLSWSHPYQRPRCIDIRLGLNDVYTKDDLTSYEHHQSADLLSAALPESSIVFSLRNDDGRWNPGNPSDVEKYLLEEQELQVRYGMDVNGVVEWIDGGVFWLSEWSTPSNGLEVSFTARDAFSLMNVSYTGIRSGTLYEVAVAALTEAELPQTVKYVIDSSLNDIYTEFPGTEGDFTVAAILQMVAHAANCVLYQDRTGVIRIEPWRKSYSGYMIEPDISYTHPEYTFNKPMKGISVGYGHDGGRVSVNVGSKGEIQTVDNSLILTEEDAIRIAEKSKEILTNRKVISGEYRADLRLDVLDNIIVTSKYASNVIGVTDITYSTSGGAFRGMYTGRVVSVELTPIAYFCNDLFVGEI
jgi:hypothetical protein